MTSENMMTKIRIRAALYAARSAVERLATEEARSEKSRRRLGIATHRWRDVLAQVDEALAPTQTARSLEPVED